MAIKKPQPVKKRAAAVILVSSAGVEPTAFRLGGERSIQLSYEDIFFLAGGAPRGAKAGRKEPSSPPRRAKSAVNLII